MRGRFTIATVAVALAAVGAGCSNGPSSTTGADAAHRTATTTTSSGDVSSNGTAGADGALLDVQGTGYSNTGTFVVPSSASGWLLTWSYTCPASASSGGLVSIGHFVVAVYAGSNRDVKDAPITEATLSGQGSQRYSDTGTFSLHVGATTGCTWSIKVTL